MLTSLVLIFLLGLAMAALCYNERRLSPSATVRPRAGRL